MQCHPDLKLFRAQLGISQSQVATALGLQRASYNDLENNHDRVPRQDTVQRILAALNGILTGRGSDRRVTYDELWSAICVGRLGVLPVPPPDVAGDLTAVDHRTAAPTAQGA